ncbi:MAG: BatA domain-containing protein [Clostridia bacterium]|nr:BatA domain-containing protein [Clostridia bacterium]
MSFQYPLGLLGLIGIPILVLIYIIKSKYTEQTVSATYLWTLSERFLKKKRKDNKLTGIISLILQILAIAIISLTIAHPVLTIPNGANEYCFILDSSGSMSMEMENSKSRFDIGKEKIKEIIEDSGNGSLYTLICVDNNTTTVFEKETDKDDALLLLDELQSGFGSQSISTALSKAQSYFDANKGALTYLVTDKAYSETENIELINVASAKDNYALSDVTYDYSVLGNLTVNGYVTSYESDAIINLQAIAGEESAQKEVSVKKGEATKFSFDLYIESFDSATVKILNSDALSLDNECVLYNVNKANSYKTLLISKTPFFLETVLKSVGSESITVMSPEDYLTKEENKSREIKGYGLYVFHSCNPKAVPDDGSVWLINSTASIENSGFNYQGEIKLDKAENITKTKASASTVRKLLSDVDGSEIYVSRYSKYDTYRNFDTLFTHNGNPVIFTGVNTYGNREVVFAFDLHNSDLPLLADYVFLVNNLIEFSFPSVIDEAFYECGEKAQINIVSNCESIRVESPRGKISHLSTNEIVSEFQLDEIGVYTVTATIAGQVRSFNVYSAMADDEKDPVTDNEGKISLLGEASGEGFDGIYDKLIIFFICLAVIMAADWVVYCYDKYQLR